MNNQNHWMSWNVRSLGGATRRMVFKKEVQARKAELLLVQETKLEEVREKVFCNLGKVLKMESI